VIGEEVCGVGETDAGDGLDRLQLAGDEWVSEYIGAIWLEAAGVC
jgi:hypothetical protein